jgi:hypothetical protein
MLVRITAPLDDASVVADESFVSLDKIERRSTHRRGMKGVYQYCSERHLHRYLAEFDHRYSNRIRLGIDDEERGVRALKGAKGKRLTYKSTDRPRPAPSGA